MVFKVSANAGFFAAFVACVAAFGVQRQNEGIWKGRAMKHLTVLVFLVLLWWMLIHNRLQDHANVNF